MTHPQPSSQTATPFTWRTAPGIILAKIFMIRAWIIRTVTSLPGYATAEAVAQRITQPLRDLAAWTLAHFPFLRKWEWLLEIERLRDYHPVMLAVALILVLWRGMKPTALGHIGTDTLIYPMLAAISMFNPFLGLCCGVTFGVGDLGQKLVYNDMYGTGGRGFSPFRDVNYFGALFGYVLAYSSVLLAGVVPGMFSRVCRLATRLAMRNFMRKKAASMADGAVPGDDPESWYLFGRTGANGLHEVAAGQETPGEGWRILPGGPYTWEQVWAFLNRLSESGHFHSSDPLPSAPGRCALRSTDADSQIPDPRAAIPAAPRHATTPGPPVPHKTPAESAETSRHPGAVHPDPAAAPGSSAAAAGPGAAHPQQPHAGSPGGSGTGVAPHQPEATETADHLGHGHQGVTPPMTRVPDGIRNRPAGGDPSVTRVPDNFRRVSAAGEPHVPGSTPGSGLDAPVAGVGPEPVAMPQTEGMDTTGSVEEQFVRRRQPGAGAVEERWRDVVDYQRPPEPTAAELSDPIEPIDEGILDPSPEELAAAEHDRELAERERRAGEEGERYRERRLRLAQQMEAERQRRQQAAEGQAPEEAQPEAAEPRRAREEDDTEVDRHLQAQRRYQEEEWMRARAEMLERDGPISGGFLGGEFPMEEAVATLCGGILATWAGMHLAPLTELPAFLLRPDPDVGCLHMEATMYLHGRAIPAGVEGGVGGAALSGLANPATGGGTDSGGSGEPGGDRGVPLTPEIAGRLNQLDQEVTDPYLDERVQRLKAQAQTTGKIDPQELQALTLAQERIAQARHEQIVSKQDRETEEYHQFLADRDAAERDAALRQQQEMQDMVRRGKAMAAGESDPSRREFLENFIDRQAQPNEGGGYDGDPDALKRALHAVRDQTYEAQQQRNLGDMEESRGEGQAYGESEHFTKDVRDWSLRANRVLSSFVPGGKQLTTLQMGLYGAADGYTEDGLKGMVRNATAMAVDNYTVGAASVLKNTLEHGGTVGEAAEEWSNQFNPAAYARRLGEVASEWDQGHYSDALGHALDTGLDARDAKHLGEHAWERGQQLTGGESGGAGAGERGAAPEGAASTQGRPGHEPVELHEGAGETERPQLETAEQRRQRIEAINQRMAPYEQPYLNAERAQQAAQEARSRAGAAGFEAEQANNHAEATEQRAHDAEMDAQRREQEHHDRRDAANTAEAEATNDPSGRSAEEAQRLRTESERATQEAREARLRANQVRTEAEAARLKADQASHTAGEADRAADQAQTTAEQARQQYLHADPRRSVELTKKAREAAETELGQAETTRDASRQAALAAEEHAQQNAQDPLAQQRAADAHDQLAQHEAEVQRRQQELTEAGARETAANDRLTLQLTQERQMRDTIDQQIRTTFNLPAAPGPAKGSLVIATDRTQLHATYLQGRRAAGTANPTALPAGVRGYNIGSKSTSLPIQGTYVHERLHANTDAAFNQAHGSQMNEGFTEHLTQELRDRNGLTNHPEWNRSSVYPQQKRFVSALQQTLGPQGADTIQNAYFRGDVQALHEQFGGALGQTDPALARQMGRLTLDRVNAVMERAAKPGPNQAAAVTAMNAINSQMRQGQPQNILAILANAGV